MYEIFYEIVELKSHSFLFFCGNMFRNEKHVSFKLMGYEEN